MLERRKSLEVLAEQCDRAGYRRHYHAVLERIEELDHIMSYVDNLTTKAK